MLTVRYSSRKVDTIFGKRSLVNYFQNEFHNNISSHLTNISTSIMKKELNSQRLVYDEGYTCLWIECMLCGRIESQSKRTILFINKTTGFFSCQCSKYSGSWQMFEKFLKSRSDESILCDPRFKADSFDCKPFQRITKSILKLSNESCDCVLRTFSFQVSSKPSLILLNARIDESQQNLYVPMLDLDSKIAGYKVLNLSEGTEQTLPDKNTFGLVGGRIGRSGGNSAIVVPSIRDSVALLDAKVPGHVICLPYGFTHLPQTVLPQFDKFNKIILWFGNDVTAWDTARNFAKKLGEKRCYFVRPTDDQPLPHLAAPAGHDLKNIVAAVQPIWHKSITTFASLRADVLAELQNVDGVQGVKWKRFPTLSKILKGHRRGELTVITGPTGCGKTTFMSEYSLDLASQGVSTLWGSFEIRNARLARTMLQQLAACDLTQHIDQFHRWADRFEQLPIYFMTFHGQQSIKVVMEAVEHATYIHDITHVVIDNVQFMMGISEESRHNDRFWKQDAIVASFRTFATKKNCHVTLVMHPRKERDADELTTSSIFGGAKASQEADNVLIIQDKRLTSIRGKKYLQVVKNRYTGDLGIMPMDFDKASLSYAQKKKKIEDKVITENG